jgi:DNA-binding transcriptional MocR family regulator
MTMPGPRAYRRLAALLRDQITSGILAPGAPLPPIGELRHQHEHSRQTVTKAMGVLQRRGSSAGGRDWATSWRTRMSNGTHLASRKAGPLRPDDSPYMLVPVVDAGPCAQRIPIGPGPGQRSPAVPPEPLAGAAEPAGPCGLGRLGRTCAGRLPPAVPCRLPVTPDPRGSVTTGRESIPA